MLAGGVLVVAGARTVHARPRDPVGWLLVAAAASWFLGAAATLRATPVGVLATALLFLHRGLLVHAVVLTAAPALVRPGRERLARVAGAAVVVAGYLTALRPWATTWLPLAVGAAVLVVAARAAVRVATRRERTAWLLVVGGTALWVVSATVLRGLPSEQLAWRLVPYEVGVATSAAGVALARTGARRVAERALRTVEVEGPASLGRALAAVLGDDGLSLHVTAAAGDVPPDGTDGRAATRLDVGPARSVVLVHRAGLLDDRRLRRDVAAVVRLVLDEQELTERAVGATRDVQASHDRLVAAEERAARDVAVAVEERVRPRLREVRSALDALAAPVPRAGPLLDDIEAELAEVARGLHAEVDLRAALASVVSASAVPATLTVAAQPGTVRPDRARALAFVAAEAVANATKHAGAGRVDLRLDGRPGRTEVRVRDDGRGGAHEVPGGGLAGLRQRVTSVGGTFEVLSGPGGTTVVARVPS